MKSLSEHRRKVSSIHWKLDTFEVGNLMELLVAQNKGELGNRNNCCPKTKERSETQMVLAQNKGKLGNRKDYCLKIEDKFESGMVLSKTKQITKWG